MKEYTNGEIVVIWDPEKCIHSRKCVEGLPRVFDRGRRPWIDMKGAGTGEIMQVIDSCPSGALSYRKEGGSGSERPAARIRVTKGGPLLVEGSCALVDPEGKEAKSCGPYALCRCGGSRRKPFCDGTHAKVEFEADK